MKPRTSPLRLALASLCGPTAQAGRADVDGLLAIAGLQLQAYEPPTGFTDPRLATVCKEAAKKGLLVTDTQGRLVGDLRAVSLTDVLPSLRDS